MVWIFRMLDMDVRSLKALKLLTQVGTEYWEMLKHGNFSQYPQLARKGLSSRHGHGWNLLEAMQSVGITDPKE